MTLISLIITLAVLGFVVYLITLIPMPTIFRQVIIGIVCLVLIIWVLQSLGLVTGMPALRLK